MTPVAPAPPAAIAAAGPAVRGGGRGGVGGGGGSAGGVNGRSQDMPSTICPDVRWMIRRDMAEVLRTEQESFEYSWTEEDFCKCLGRRDCVGFVAEHDEAVIGFMVYQLHAARLHVLNFAVHPAFRWQGVGRQMVAKLIGKLSSHRRTRITLAVRETNLPAQLFFKSQGFRAERILRGYYEDSGEDAFLMQYRIADDTAEDANVPARRIQGAEW
jgi:[ribosomal protein S18]-alanine N-acetyltransferase